MGSYKVLFFTVLTPALALLGQPITKFMLAILVGYCLVFPPDETFRSMYYYLFWKKMSKKVSSGYCITSVSTQQLRLLISRPTCAFPYYFFLFFSSPCRFMMVAVVVALSHTQIHFFSFVATHTHTHTGVCCTGDLFFLSGNPRVVFFF